MCKIFCGHDEKTFLNKIYYKIKFVTITKFYIIFIFFMEKYF